ncbi:MAG: glycosyltransferase family 2 protein [Candidatus Saccharibacteria bacterium]
MTVVVCTYNRVQWLPKCLRSLEEQDPHPDEIIVVDGPSNDGTRAMLELLEQQGHLTLVRQERLDGISSARNLGLSRAKGEIVCFIDDDAIAEPGWLAAILTSYTDQTVGGVGGPVLDMNGQLTMGRNAVSSVGKWFDESRNESTTGLYPVMVGCNMSFRRDALNEIGGFDPYFKFHQDETDACLGVLFAGSKILYSEGASVRHEWCEGSYRKDRIRWYIRLRYLWGRNNSYLVHKHFGESVGFSSYCGSRMADFVGRRVPRGIMEKEEKGCGEGGKRMPQFFVMMGLFSEVFGLLQGWKDSAFRRSRNV